MHRGLGRQASLMWFNILGFWMVGFTMGWALTFKARLGLSGIWLGILSGVTTTGVPPLSKDVKCGILFHLQTDTASCSIAFTSRVPS